MDSTIAIVLVCGLLNVIPWLLLLYFERTDEALAIVAKALFERLESLEELAGEFGGFQEINPVQSLIAKFLEGRLAVNDVYERDANGQFNGAQTLKEIDPEEID
jgi:hypothetical protein